MLIFFGKKFVAERACSRCALCVSSVVSQTDEKTEGIILFCLRRNSFNAKSEPKIAGACNRMLIWCLQRMSFRKMYFIVSQLRAHLAQWSHYHLCPCQPATVAAATVAKLTYFWFYYYYSLLPKAINYYKFLVKICARQTQPAIASGGDGSSTRLVETCVRGLKSACVRVCASSPRVWRGDWLHAHRPLMAEFRHAYLNNHNS